MYTTNYSSSGLRPKAYIITMLTVHFIFMVKDFKILTYILNGTSLATFNRVDIEMAPFAE